MSDEDFRKLCNTFGFAPSRALRELIDCAMSQAALAEPVQDGCDHCNHPLYAAIKCAVCGRTTEPQPQRKPLTEEEIMAVYTEFMLYEEGLTSSGLQRVARAIERAHGIGDNT